MLISIIPELKFNVSASAAGTLSCSPLCHPLLLVHSLTQFLPTMLWVIFYQHSTKGMSRGDEVRGLAKVGSEVFQVDSSIIPADLAQDLLAAVSLQTQPELSVSDVSGASVASTNILPSGWGRGGMLYPFKVGVSLAKTRVSGPIESPRPVAPSLPMASSPPPRWVP